MISRARTLTLTGIVASLAVASACTSEHRRQQQPNGSASAASAAAALAALQRQASYAENVSFTASYRAQGDDPPRTGTVTVFHTPSATRIDVDEGGTNVRILVTAKGTFSCKFAGTAKTPLCVTLAGPDAEIPQPLDPGLQHLFTSALDEIRSGKALHVELPPTQPVKPSAASAASATCFVITAAPTSGDLAPGTYCFSEGMLVSAKFRTSSLQLTTVGTPPTPGDFALPAPPVALSSPSRS